MGEKADDQQREWVLAALEAYECRLTRYAARLLGSEQSARDAVQHTFLRLCDRRPDDLQDRLGPWLFTVCRNRAMDLLRERSATESLDAEDTAPAKSPAPDPAEEAERGDLYACLTAAVAELPAAQREVVDLWTAGFSHREIADITGHKPGHVRVLVHRALAGLRRHPVAREVLSQRAEPNSRSLHRLQPE